MFGVSEHHAQTPQTEEHPVSDEIDRPEPAGGLAVGGDAVAARDAARAARADLTRQQQAVERQAEQARAELDRARRELEEQFAAKRAELEARMAPLRAEMERMTEVLWTCDLYLGRREDLVPLRGGEPAPVSTPITVRQKVLSMAEESLVLMGKNNTGMDAEDVPEFVRWLAEDDDHLARVLPEPKGVVALVPTRLKSDRENVWEKAAKDAANRRTHWLIRNGQRLFMLTTDPELRVGERILPTRTEFTEVFERRLFGFARDAGPVEPGSAEWLRMQEVADAKRRHYMRLMLVLQGLIDRTDVFRPLPATGVNLLDAREQDRGRVVIVQDDDVHALLADGRPSFRQWQSSLNARLRPGMRVIGDWNTRAFDRLYSDGDRYSRGSHPRLYPGSVECRPEANVPHVIEGRRDGMLVIRFERTDKVWRRNVPVPDQPGYVYRGEMPTEPTQRASCLIAPDDSWVLPLDLASVDDLRYYLDSRTNREEHFLSMVPTVRAALAAKEAEAATEAPFRGLLADMLTTAGHENADSDVDRLIHAWKVANAWFRPLNGDPAHEAKAARQIVQTWQKETATETDPTRRAAIFLARSRDDALAVARRSDGRWVLLTVSPGAHDPRVFVDVHTVRKDGTLGACREWQTLSPRQVSTMTLAWTSEEWDRWTFPTHARHHLTEPERAALVEQIVTPGTVCVTEWWDPTDPGRRLLRRWAWTADQPPAEHPAFAAHDALDQHHRGECPVAATQFVVTKGRDGARVGDGHAVRTSFGSYSIDGGRPWWPDTARRYGDTRWRLTWVDEPLLADLDAWTKRCRALYEQDRAEKQDRAAVIHAWTVPVMDAIREAQIADAYAEFIADYGPDATDLWPRHRDGLRLSIPAGFDNDVKRLIRVALDDGTDPTGMTLDSLRDHFDTRRAGQKPAWGDRTWDPITVDPWGHVVVTGPTDEDSDDD